MSVLFPEIPPGTRMLHGRLDVFDFGAFNDWRAVCAKMDAPVTLCCLSDDDLTGLLYAGIRVDAMSSGRDPDLMRRAEAERLRRIARAATRLALQQSVALLARAAQ